MKKHLLLFVISCLFANLMFAQTEIVVPAFAPDALLKAVEAADSADVLVLADGGIYPNTATMDIQVPITIKTVDGAAAKAKIVKLADAGGAYNGRTFWLSNSATLKNIIFDGQPGNTAPQSWRAIHMRDLGAGKKVHLDGLEFSRFTHVFQGGDCDTVIVENCLFNGNLSGAGGWGMGYHFVKKTSKYIRIQNNTFMFSIYGINGGGWGNYSSATVGTLIIDHNTYYNVTGAHGSTTQFMRVNNVQITNNLYINPTFRPIEYFSDKYVDYPANADDITNYLGQISHLGPKGLWVFAAEMADSANMQVDMQNNNVTWTSDVLDLWANKGLEKPWIMNNELKSALLDTTDTHFAEEVTFTDAPDVPMFAITHVADSCVAGNADTAAYHGKTPFSGYDWWNTDFTPTFDLRATDGMDMSYNANAVSYKAADGGFPLGDLNWFPDKKAEWETYITGVENISDAQPAEYELSQNYPNPFNPTTNIMFTLKKASNVKLAIFNAMGQKVKTLVNKKVSAGAHNLQWDSTNQIGENVVSGIYFYKLDTGEYSKTMKMLLIK